MQTEKTAHTTGNLAGEHGVRLVSATFRHIMLVVFLIFIFAVVQMFTLWQVGKTGMQTATSLKQQGLPALNELALLEENLVIYRLDSYEYLFIQQEEKAGKAKAAEAVAVQIHLELKGIQTLLPEGEGRQLAANLEKAINDLDAQFQKVRGLVDSDFPAAMKSMDQDIPPRTERVDAAADALKNFGYQFSGAQAGATFASFGWIKNTAVMFGIGNSFVAFCAVMFVLLAARRSRAQLSETLARLDERTHELQQTNDALKMEVVEHQRAEESLRLLGSAVEQSKESIVITDAELDLPGPKIIFVNPAFTQMTGYTAAEAIGKNPRILQGPRTDKVVLSRLRKNLEQGEVFTGEAINYRKEGREFDMEWQIAPIRNSNGKITHFVAIQRDITARKQAENILRESNEKFNQLANNITDVFWIRSPDMSEVHYVSPAFERIWGRSVASLYSDPQQWSNFILPEDRKRVLAGFAALTGDTRSLDIEYRIVRPDGNIRWIRTRGFQGRDVADKLIRHIGVVTDITERKQFEAQLFQSQKMETVGKLAGGIAHEFNSILTAIIGQSELLAGELPHGNPLVKNAAEIRKAAERAAILTRQLLAYGRKQILQPEILDLNAVLTGMENMILHLMGRNVEVRLNPSAGLKSVTADAGQIEQVVVNIAMNAAEAMPNGGKLTLETANVTLDADYVSRFPELKAGEYTMLAIGDTGAGMSDEVKARVFEPFFTTKGVGKGTGLGLATCHGIIKQSGGHIAVYSELGRGTTFKIYLPQAGQEMKSPTQPKASADLPRGTERILLVEDDPSLREMAGELLERLDYTVLTAANGIEAMSIIHQQGRGHIDLLFTDVVMPHMSGKELADRIHALHPQTKILFTSAYTESAIVHQGVLDKSVALLQKPYTPSALAQKLREVLDAP